MYDQLFDERAGIFRWHKRAIVLLVAALFDRLTTFLIRVDLAGLRLLREMAEEQGRRFEQVFADPANKALAARTYRAEQRPTASSTSGSELQRR
jgi:hypothetical protein